MIIFIVISLTMMEAFAYSLPTLQPPPSHQLEYNQGPLIAAVNAFTNTLPLEKELDQEIAVDIFISRLLRAPYLTAVAKNILKQIQKHPSANPLMANILKFLRSEGLRRSLITRNFIEKLKPLQTVAERVNPRHHPLDLLLQQILLPHPNRGTVRDCKKWNLEPTLSWPYTINQTILQA